MGPFPLNPLLRKVNPWGRPSPKDGQVIDEDNPLVNVLWRFQVGDRVELTVLRRMEEMKIEVALTQKPQ